MNQLRSCSLSIPVFCISMAWSWGVGYGWTMCSGDSIQVLSVATAPSGRDFDAFLLPLDPPASMMMVGCLRYRTIRSHGRWMAVDGDLVEMMVRRWKRESNIDNTCT